MGLPANARTSPDGEKETACTQPPAGLTNSPQTVPNGSFSPQNVGAGLNNATVSLSYHQTWGGNADFLSTSLMYAEKTRAFMSALPAASKTLFGCQSMERTVDLIGFLSSFETHQLLSLSKEQMAIALITAGQRRLGSQQGTALWVAPGTTGNGELVLKRTPADESSGTVDIQQHQGRLPFQPTSLGVGGLRPHVGVPILRCGDNPVRILCPIDRCDQFIVLYRRQQLRSLVKCYGESDSTNLG